MPRGLGSRCLKEKTGELLERREEMQMSSVTEMECLSPSFKVFS